MKIFERIFPLCAVLWLISAFVSVMGMAADAGTWAWWMGFGVLVSGVLLMIGLAVCWEKETGEKPVVLWAYQEKEGRENGVDLS